LRLACLLGLLPLAVVAFHLIPKRLLLLAHGQSLRAGRLRLFGLGVPGGLAGQLGTLMRLLAVAAAVDLLK
jgi:hypothetical protein